MLPTSVTFDPRKVSPVGSEEAGKEGCVLFPLSLYPYLKLFPFLSFSLSLARGCPERNEKESAVCQSTSSLLLGVAHAWRIDRNRRGEFPMCARGWVIPNS